MTENAADRSDYVTTGVVIAITAVITWIVGRQIFDRQAAAMAAADGPINFGAPLMTLVEIGAILLGMAITFAIFGAVRVYKRAGDSS